MKKIVNKKNNHGFTLIEILGVIIILSLILLLTIPKIISSVDNYDDDVNDVVLKVIESAAIRYINDNTFDFPKKEQNKYCISISELIKNEYLKGPIVYQENDITNTHSIKATYDNGFSFDLINKNECIICKGVTETTKTLGNIPNGDFEPGDEYICEVTEGIKYTFFVLNREKTKVNLIMSENMGETVAWSNLEITKGPIDALVELDENTLTWDNIDLYDHIIFDDSGDNYTLNRTNVRARLLTYEEAVNYGCVGRISESLETTNTCATWLYGNFKQPPYAYWLSSSVSGSTNYAWYITYFGDIRYTNVVGSPDGTNITSSSSYGIRPVISVSVSKIIN